MSLTRSLIFSTLIIGLAAASVAAQARGPRIPPPREPQYLEPRTNLEVFEGRLETVLVRGYSFIAALNVRNGSVRVRALQIKDLGNSTRTAGVEIMIREAGDSAPDVRCLMDYEEIDAFITGIDVVSKADDTITKLTNFEVSYRTRGEFEVIVFKQTSGGIAAAIEGGYFERTRLLLTLDELARLRWMVLQAKAKLDEIK